MPDRAFESQPVPVRKRGCGTVGALKERHQGGVGILRLSHGVVGQEELPERSVEIGLGGLDRGASEPWRLRVRVRIEGCKVDAAAAGPKTGAAELVGVGLLHHQIGNARSPAWMQRRAAARKSRHRQIEATPEEMHWAALADEPCAKLLEDAVHLDERAPKPVRMIGVVCTMRFVEAEGDRTRYLTRKLRDSNRDAELSEGGDDGRIEARYSSRLQRDPFAVVIARRDDELMLTEVELHLEAALFVRNERSRQAAHRRIEGNMPGMIEPRRAGEPDLANDLRPKMKRCAGILPFRVWKFRPVVFMVWRFGKRAGLFLQSARP